MKYQYRITGETLSVTDPQIRTFSLALADERANEVIRLAKLAEADTATDADLEKLAELIDPAKVLAAAYAGTNVSVDRFGNVTLAGVPVSGTVAKRIVDADAYGDPRKVKSYALFIERVKANPSADSIADLFDWLETSDLGILEDGRFVAYKVVNNDYTDCHSGTIDNSVGVTVRMPGGRAAVDANNRVLCSTGLHFCSKGYLSSFGYREGGEKRVLVLAVDPADVVAVPQDHGRQKGRAVQYEVIDEVDVSEDAVAREWGLVNQHPAIVVDEEPGEEFDNIYGVLEDAVNLEGGEGDAPKVEDTFFVAPADSTAPARTPWRAKWRKAIEALRD